MTQAPNFWATEVNRLWFDRVMQGKTFPAFSLTCFALDLWGLVFPR